MTEPEESDCNNRALELCSRGNIAAAYKMWATNATHRSSSTFYKTSYNSLLLQWRLGELGPSNVISFIEAAVATEEMTEEKAAILINSVLCEGGHSNFTNSRY